MVLIVAQQMLLSSFMAYRSLVEVLAGVKHLPRYAALLTSSAPRFRYSSLLGSCAQSVTRWVCAYVDRNCPKPEAEPVPIIEIDEMWHYLQRKTNWIWKAYDRAKDRLINWECGRRDEATFRRLERSRLRLYCTDDYVVYDNVLPVGRHYVGKDESIRPERNNGRQRHWVASCRRSIVVSRSGAMIDRRTALFAHLHVNRCAKPEMRRLPIAQKRRIRIA
jgi:insertion element IS1 protein InsB